MEQNITSMNHGDKYSVNINEVFKTFNQTAENIDKQIGHTNNLKKLKSEIIQMSADLNMISGSLPAHDIRNYSLKIEQLLKKVNVQDTKERLRQHAPSKFKFTIKPKREEKNLDSIHNSSTPEFRDTPALTLNDDLKIVGANSLFQNLEHCTISDEAITCCSNLPVSGSGSLHFRNLTSCIVNINCLPFSQGSIFIEDCKKSLIIIKMFNNPNCNTQIRLSAVIGCKLYILKGGNEKQTIVMEKCSDCIFHESTKENVIIQDFSNLNGIASNAFLNYRFDDFDLCNFDTDNLRSLIM